MMVASTDMSQTAERPTRYPEIVSGMPVADRRQAVDQLRSNVPGHLWNKEFEQPGKLKAIMVKPEDLPRNSRKGRATGGEDLCAYFGESARLPLLTREEEVFHFRRMNFVRWRAEQALETIDSSKPQLKAMRQIVSDLKQGDDDRNFIAEHNLRLVIPLAHRFHLRSESVWDYVSEGNAALLRAIKGFDYGRGFRFSTYATWAIVNSMQRLAGKQVKDSGRCPPSDTFVLDSVEGDLESATAEDIRVTSAREKIAQMMNLLDKRSQSVISMRYGVGTSAEPKTLREIGDQLGVSKERVRQIEQKALASMMSARKTLSIRA